MITLRSPDLIEAPAMSRVVIASISDLCAADYRDDPLIIARWTANNTPENTSRWIENAEALLVVAIQDDVEASP
ncbi:MAG: hypothetical protein AAGF44_02145 [Pseudomonadota bacterium]